MTHNTMFRAKPMLDLNNYGAKHSAYATRLGRIGFRIAGTPEGNAFASTMAVQDYAKALAVIQGQPNKFSNGTRQCIFNKCQEVFWKSRRPEMVFLVERIGYPFMA